MGEEISLTSLRPFRTDGCSFVLDKLLGVDLWETCAAHDGMDLRLYRRLGDIRPHREASYWRGGPLYMRAIRDGQFKALMYETAMRDPRASHYWWSLLWRFLAWERWLGVRIFGHPFLPTPWRWGYGYPWPRYK